MKVTITITEDNFTDKQLFEVLKAANLALGEPDYELKKPETEKPAEKKKKAKSPKVDPTDRPEDQVVSADATTGKTATKADVRSRALTLSTNGRTDELKAVFREFGAEKLTEIKEEDYPAVIEKLEELINE